jgi:Putative binding domain, N-terminal
VTVTAGSGCAWTAVSNNSWIVITSGSSGSGNGTVTYSVGLYGGPPKTRTGNITIAGKTLTVKQTK